MTISFSIKSNPKYPDFRVFPSPKPSKKLDYRIRLSPSVFQGVDKIIIPSPAPKIPKPLLSPSIGAGAKVCGDLSSVFRQVLSSSYRLQGKETPAALTALGFTNAFAAIFGALGIQSALEEIKTAEKATDTVGKILAGFKALSGGTLMMNGATMFSSRLLTIGEILSASKVLGIASGIFGRIGTYFANAGLAIGSIATGIRIFELYSFRSHIDAIMNQTGLPEQERVRQGFQFLKSFTTISAEEREEIRKAFPEASAKELEEKGELLLMKKGEAFKRLAGSECLQMVRENKLEDAQAVLESVQDVSRKKIFLASVAFGLTILGIIAVSAWLILSAPELAVFTPLIGIAGALGGLANDVYGWIGELKPSSGQYDQAWMVFSALLAVASVAFTSVLSGDWPAIAGAAAFGVLWLGIETVGYFSSTQVTA